MFFWSYTIHISFGSTLLRTLATTSGPHIGIVSLGLVTSRDAFHSKLVNGLITIAETTRCHSYTHPQLCSAFEYSQTVSCTPAINLF